eukprot:8293309-Heterocapsa_arctica.AAC.1
MARNRTRRAACRATYRTEWQRSRLRARIIGAVKRASISSSGAFVGLPLKQLIRASAKLLFIDASLA